MRSPHSIRDLPHSLSIQVVTLSRPFPLRYHPPLFHCYSFCRYSNLTCSNNLGDNPPEEQLFQKRGELLPIGADGSVKLTVHPEEIYTLTTLKSGGKGIAPKPSPPSTPFPLPFHQDFDHENISAPPAYWYENYSVFTS